MVSSSVKILILILVFLGTLLPGGEVLSQETSTNAGLKKIDFEQTGVPRIFWRSVEYGVGAGTLVGIAAITDFRKNFKLNVDDKSVARGASYGLYGGIILGLYLAYVVPNKRDDDPGAEGARPPEASESGSVLETRSWVVPQVSPLWNLEGALGVQIKWNI
jgi:hypothetical protein